MPASDYIFDGPNKLIILTNTGSIEFRDTYSRWKEWTLESSNARYLQAIRYVGGDPITDTKSLGTTYFLINGWKIRPYTSSYTLDIDGNLYAEQVISGSTTTVDPISMPSGSYQILVRLNVSNLVDAEVLESTIAQILEYQGCVLFDLNGVSGSAYPVGTSASPVNNVGDLKLLLNNYNIHCVKLFDDITLDQSFTDISFEGNHKGIFCTLVSGSNYEGCSFDNLSITGTSNGSIDIKESQVYNINNLYGVVRECGLSGSISLNEMYPLTMHNCYSIVPGTASPIINASGSMGGFNMRSYSGGLRIISASNPNFISTVEYIAGRFTSDPSNTAGIISVRGLAALNNQGTTLIESSSLINAASFNSVTAAPDPDVSNKVNELWQVHGLDPNESVYVDVNQRQVANISQSIVNVGSGSASQTTISRI